MSKETTPQSNNNEEVDLGQLFKIIGNGFRNLFQFIKSIFVGIFDLIMLFLIFIQKHLIKFVIAGIIGLAAGFYMDKEQGDVYEAQMIVEPNFKSVEQLYNNIGFYNNLAKEKDSITLQEVLNLETSSEAASILKFTIEPHNNENLIITQYNQFVEELDTTTLKDVTYKEFLNNYDDLDSKYHKITLLSSNNLIAGKIQKTIVESVNENEYFELLKETNDENIKLRELIIKEQLATIDTLQDVYKKALVETAKNTNSGTSINLASEKEAKIKELELLNKKGYIKDELVSLYNEKARRKSTINIISDFPRSSTKVQGIVKSNKFSYAWKLVLITFIVLVLIEFNKYLKTYRTSRGV